MSNTHPFSLQGEGGVNSADAGLRHPRDLGVAWNGLPTAVGIWYVITSSLLGGMCARDRVNMYMSAVGCQLAIRHTHLTRHREYDMIAIACLPAFDCFPWTDSCCVFLRLHVADLIYLICLLLPTEDSVEISV